MVRSLLPKAEVLDLIMLAFWAALLLIVLIFIDRLLEAQAPVTTVLLAEGAGVAATFLMVHLTRAMDPSWRVFLRFPLVVGTIFGGFWVVGNTIHIINPHDMEPYLLVFDRFLWGASFAEWIEPYQKPWITDILQLCYTSYYFLPITLYFVLLVQGRPQQANLLMTGVVLAFLSNFLLYLAVPARSPYVIASDPSTAHLVQFAAPLQGGALTHWLRDTIEAAEFNMRDCFPSGHTYISLVTLIGCWRYEKRLFPIYAAIISGLILGTLYLRYHYVIDLVAGALAAYLVTRWVPRWCTQWSRS